MGCLYRPVGQPTLVRRVFVVSRPQVCEAEEEIAEGKVSRFKVKYSYCYNKQSHRD